MNAVSSIWLLSSIMEQIHNVELPPECPNMEELQKTEKVLGVMPEELKKLYVLYFRAEQERIMAVNRRGKFMHESGNGGGNPFLQMEQAKAKATVLWFVFRESVSYALPNALNVSWAVRKDWQIAKVSPGLFRRSPI